MSKGFILFNCFSVIAEDECPFEETSNKEAKSYHAGMKWTNAHFMTTTGLQLTTVGKSIVDSLQTNLKGKVNIFLIYFSFNQG